MAGPGFYRPGPEGLSLLVRVTPNAGRDSLEGIGIAGDGRCLLRVRVSAVPDKGKANAAVIALLAKALRVPRSAVTVASGETARSKTIAVAGNAVELARRLEALVSG